MLDMQAVIKDAGAWSTALGGRFDAEVRDTRSIEMKIKLSGKQPRLFEE